MKRTLHRFIEAVQGFSGDPLIGGEQYSAPKLISEERLREKRKRYFGTFILVNIAELLRSEDMPPLDASEK